MCISINYYFIEIHKKEMSITEILDNNNVKREKCKCCGGDILYDSTKVVFKKDGTVHLNGQCSSTYKDVFGKRYYLSVCQKCLFDKFGIQKTSFNIMCEPTKFAFGISDDDYLKSRANYAMTKDKMISKYGEIEGLKRWEDYCNIQSETNTFEYKHKKYGWTKKQFNDYNKSRAVTLKNLTDKYGEDGERRFNEYVEKQRLTKSWDYMVATYGEKKAREINKSKALTKETFIRVHGEEEETKRWEDYITKAKRGFSDVSQECFDKIDFLLKDYFTTYYASKNSEYAIYDDNCIYYLDYYIKELNLCIEFNGGCFHGDERIYEDDNRCNPFDKTMTAKELREKDKNRYENLYKKFGIKTFVIWELDYNDNWDAKNFIINTLKIDL